MKKELSTENMSCLEAVYNKDVCNECKEEKVQEELEIVVDILGEDNPIGEMLESIDDIECKALMIDLFWIGHSAGYDFGYDEACEEIELAETKTGKVN